MFPKNEAMTSIQLQIKLFLICFVNLMDANYLGGTVSWMHFRSVSEFRSQRPFFIPLTSQNAIIGRYTLITWFCKLHSFSFIIKSNMLHKPTTYLTSYLTVSC